MSGISAAFDNVLFEQGFRLDQRVYIFSPQFNKNLAIQKSEILKAGR